MKMLKVTILGTEVEANLLNPEVAKLYEDGFETTIKKIREATTVCKTGSEGISYQCMAVMNYVESVFGEDAKNKIFGKETDLLTCLDVLEDMTTVYERDVVPVIRQKTTEIENKFKESDIQ